MPIQSSTAGIPLAAHSPLSSHRHATDSNASIHHETSGRVGMNTLGSSHGRMQPLDNNTISARRWHRLQRRSPLDSASGSQSHSHHSPRGARLLSSVASTTGHVHLTSRERQYQTRRDRLSIGDHREHDPSSSVSSPSILYQPHPSRLRGLSNMADPQQSALPISSSVLSDIVSESQQQQQQQGMLMPMEGSTPADSLVSFMTSERATDLARQLGTHSSTHILSSASSSTPRSWSSSFQTERPSQNIPTLTSTPMERTLTNNPVMSSASNIAAATAEPTAIVISVASSSPGGSAFSGASPPSTQMGSLSTMTDFMRNQTSREQSHARSDETAPIQRDGDFTSLDLHHRSTEPLSSTWQQHSLPDRREPDDRINFRLLGNVYFSTWARQSLGDADNDYNMNSQSESEVQPRDPRTDRALAMLGDDRADTDEIMSENEGDGFGPSQSLRQRVAHESNREERGRFGYEESSGDEIDDDDDGIDLVIEERRHRGSNSAGTSNEPGSPSTPAPSHLERPQHAQLSPRSAAVLTSVLSSRRSLWSQSITNSSLTPSLLAQARQHARQYEGNPHFRRTPFPLNLQSPSSLSRPDLRSLGSRVYLSHEAQRAADSECLVDAESGLDPWLIEPGSVSTQYETIQYACGGLDLGSHLVDPNSCSENGFTRDLGRQDVWPLKFDMYFADGGEFNASHSVENVLKNDSSVYCSRRSTNINICLRIAEPHRTFVLTQLRAKAPTSGFTAPCKEGLVFISHEPISLDKTAFFNNMTKERYDEYIESINRRIRAGEPPHPESDEDVMQPAAFFQLNGLDDSCTLDLTPNRSGRYVVIKLLRSRCTNSLQTPENIDLQYLGLIGYTGSRSFASAALL